MVINVNVHDEGNWHIEHVKADVIEFSAVKPGYIIVNEGEHLIPLYNVISIRNERKGR